jgi:uncharacterized LabA/DUF88 family protein
MEEIKKENNYAFIDGQNLYSGTRDDGWFVNHAKLRKYLLDKYDVIDAYYFLGYMSDIEQNLYNNLEKAGFKIVFKDHISTLKGTKRGNVDTDIVFEIMRNLIETKDIDKIIIISGDGDYRKLVKYLFEHNKFKKILFPNKKFASSLYKDLGSEFFDYLENIKTYIAWSKNKKGS